MGRTQLVPKKGQGFVIHQKIENCPGVCPTPAFSWHSLPWRELSRSSSVRPSCWVYVCWVLSETRWWVEAELVLPMQLGGLWAASAPSGQAVCWQRL